MATVQVGFEAPGHLHELLALMNAKGMRLSLVDQRGTVYGHLADLYGQTAVRTPTGDGLIRVLHGSDEDADVVFSSDDVEDIASFLHGCFFGIFRGKRLEDIHNAVTLPFEEPQS